MRTLSSLLAVACLLFTPVVANAAKGVVVLYKSGCSYYIVETNLGYAILEWYGGNDPSEGDVLVGDYETYGMKDIYNLTADAETKVWVEDFWLSKSRAIEKYYDKCN
ncbi:MAG: hypothetical protein KJ550_09655 [Proteobacteria bacterium]|nr:hypothetical protein [Desulfobacteraceae bacterium]MBU3980606.1 hypothetical protein [Pseudomonadota bacterium]MBU4013719.1 hypothetical protein [Pseudomonadota bacterium]MBU4068054.1 hypothetical protein [Pseudomonadota bacterium]MBU4101502.1 hypothetical protein [Pseudomonadota bacterium]